MKTVSIDLDVVTAEVKDWQEVGAMLFFAGKQEESGDCLKISANLAQTVANAAKAVDPDFDVDAYITGECKPTEEIARNGMARLVKHLAGKIGADPEEAEPSILAWASHNVTKAKPEDEPETEPAVTPRF